MKTILVVMSLLWVMTADAAQAVLSEGAGTAQVRVAFTPGDDVSGMIVAAIHQAQRQVLVQLFSFTDRDIAQALAEAQRRGVDVRVLADREQTERLDRGQVTTLVRMGVPVWLDGEHQSAHNKVMVIDQGSRNSLVITGSYNFTYAAQHKNAENILFLSGNDKLAASYAANWQRHQAHAVKMVLH